MNDFYERGIVEKDIFSKRVRAGKRTYFFDVRESRNGDHYLTITEMKKSIDEDGNANSQKFKIYLYKEDFTKFINSLEETISFIENISKTEK